MTNQLLDLDNLQDNSQNSTFKLNPVLIITIIGVLLVTAGIFLFTKPLWESPQIQVIENSGSAIVETGIQTVTVEIVGAISKPGVYKLPASERVERLLVEAGGLSGKADREWVAKNLNQAAKLSDGQKIYIPKIGEIKTGTGASGNLGSGNQANVLSVTTLINLNTATVSELDSLPGIGQTRAQAIISNRPFSSVEELLNKKVIPKNVYEDIKSRVSAP